LNGTLGVEPGIKRAGLLDDQAIVGADPSFPGNGLDTVEELVEVAGRERASLQEQSVHGSKPYERLGEPRLVGLEAHAPRRTGSRLQPHTLQLARDYLLYAYGARRR
jgi:hypothetical protein